MDATNAATTTNVEYSGLAVVAAVCCNVIEDDGEAPYFTFMDGWRFRFDHWHIHPWFGDQVRRLAPPPTRPRRIETTGKTRRWTSGFK
jgi:hypothetical protein